MSYAWATVNRASSCRTGSVPSRERRQGGVAGERDRPREPGPQVGPRAVGAELAVEVNGARIDLVEDAGESRERLPHPLDRQLGEPLELDRVRCGEVLVDEDAAHEVPVLQGPREGHVRLGSLCRPPLERVFVEPEHAVVGHAVEVRTEQELGRDLPAVLEPPPTPVVVVLHALVHPEPTEAAALPLREDVPGLRRAADATTLEEVESEGGVLTVRDRPEKRNLGEEPAPARRPEHGRQEAGLALAPNRRGEEREERHQRDTLGPEARVRPVDQGLEVPRGPAEAERPRGRLPLL